MSQHSEFGMALEYVADIDAAKRFYTDVVGLKVEREHPQFVQFDHFAIASDAAIGELRERELYWLVSDVESAFAELSKKVEITMPLKELPFGKVFGIRSPSGETCYMLEFAKNRPSHSV